jgi:uncharacterized membrane protein YdfJ with MMPL/SSD domain
LTIAGQLCLSSTRTPYFPDLRRPVRSGQLVAVAVALTLVPPMLARRCGFGPFDPKRKMVVCMTEMSMSKSIHDMSNPADFLIPRKLTEKILRA